MKKLAIVCAIAIMLTMITPFAAVSAATNSNGVLFWDFETTDDVAEHGPASDAWGISKAPDVIGSGAWTRQIPTVGPVFGHPWITSFDKLYLADGNTPWNLITQAETDANFGSLPLTNGGEKCIAMYSADNGQGPVAFGPVIQLEDTRLIPDVTYTLEFDVLTSSAFARSIYAGFSKPSDRPSGAIATGSYPWFVAGNAMQALVNEEDRYAVQNEWKHMTVELTPSSAMYEDGNILLYISAGDIETRSTANAKEWLYLDNIKLTPKTALTDKVAYAKFSYGKVWDFEDDYGRDGSGNYVMDAGIPGNASGGQNDVYPTTFANGDWSLFTETGDAYFRGPRIRSIADAKLYNNTPQEGTGSEGTDDGYNGSPAPGSNYCARMRPHANFGGAWNKGTLGMRVRLTKDEFPTGNYSLSFYSGWSKPSSDAFNMCVSIFAGEKLIVDTGTTTGDMTAVTESFADATQTFTLGSVGRQWAKYTQDIELTDDDFDANGVATLIIHTSIGQLPPSAMLYIDDISLIPDYELIPEGDINGFVTSVSYGEYEDVMTAAAVYYDEKCEYLTNADAVTSDISGVTRNSVKLNVSEEVYNDGWPTIKVYMFDKYFAPVLDEAIMIQ